MSVSIDLEHLIRVANCLADAAAVETLKLFRSSELASENKLKEGFDPVTQADRAAERAMRDVLKAERPDDGILGEEYGAQDGVTGLNWVLDPIDGTRAYLCGAASWGTLISVEFDGEPLVGLLDQPYMGERFVGTKGTATVFRGNCTKPVKTRRCRSISEAILLTTFPEVGTPEERQAFYQVGSEAKLTRYGLDCYGYALVAMGQSDLVIEAGLNRYDISAPLALVEAAGGIVTNWQGEPLTGGGQVIAAGDERVHAQALELLNS